MLLMDKILLVKTNLSILEESVHKNPHYQSVKEIQLNRGYQFEKLLSCFNESNCADITEQSFEDIGESTPLPIRARVIGISDGNEENSKVLLHGLVCQR